MLVGGDGGAVLSHQPVDGRAQADGLQDRRGAGLEAVRRVGVGDRVHGHRADHLAAALVGRHAGQPLGLAVEHADAGGAVELVAGEDVEVRVQRLHVHRAVHHGLAAVEQHPGAGGVGRVGDLARRVDASR